MAKARKRGVVPPGGEIITDTTLYLRTMDDRLLSAAFADLNKLGCLLYLKWHANLF